LNLDAACRVAELWRSAKMVVRAWYNPGGSSSVPEQIRRKRLLGAWNLERVEAIEDRAVYHVDAEIEPVDGERLSLSVIFEEANGHIALTVMRGRDILASVLTRDKAAIFSVGTMCGGIVELQTSDTNAERRPE
jgi:hypothetical protein